MKNDFILAEAAIVESLRRSNNVKLHPRLSNALLIYESTGKRELAHLYNNYISVAYKARVPIVICTPTWRANKERLSEIKFTGDVNSDAVRFLKQLRDKWGSWEKNILIGGLVGCKNDCYKPSEGLVPREAYSFHSWQLNKLAEAGVDFLIAETLPAAPEAKGIAQAMSKTGVPYFICFVINRKGNILDGNTLEYAISDIDSVCNPPPTGFMINCSYPSFLNANKQPISIFSRLIGYLANASSLDQSELEDSKSLEADDVTDWGNQMIELNKKYSVKILGGCCGTNVHHLQYIVNNINKYDG